MEAFSERLLKKLEIRDSIAAEAKSARNLVAEEPGWSRLAEQAGTLADHVESRLRYGFVPSPQQETLARKPGLECGPWRNGGPSNGWSIAR